MKENRYERITAVPYGSIHIQTERLRVQTNRRNLISTLRTMSLSLGQ